MRKANRAHERLTHSFPRNKMTSPITLRRPIFRILFIIRSAAIEEALKKLLPVIAICRCQKDTVKHQLKKGNSLRKLLPIIAISRHQEVT